MNCKKGWMGGWMEGSQGENGTRTFGTVSILGMAIGARGEGGATSEFGWRNGSILRPPIEAIRHF